VTVDEHMLSLDLRMAVRIVAYDPSWPALFEVESKLLKSALQPWLAGPIEHVGSTAVPGLCAKPTVDIMAAVESLEASRDAIQALAAHDYCYSPYKTSQMHWFCKPSPEVRRYHLHLVPFGSSLWNERLGFRDALIREPDLATEYAALKQKLAAEFRFDRDAYTDAKSPFIRRVLEAIGDCGDAGPSLL
jgi:GrpB-like predicted nucleotidyltransferase (UPF0157 family)